jgi:hypothetical protein
MMNHNCNTPGPLTPLAAAIAGDGGHRAGFEPFISRNNMVNLAQDFTLTRLARLVATRMADAVERQEVSVRVSPADTPWASAALIEIAKTRLIAQGYTVSTVENELGNNVGWRVAW